MKFFQYQTTLIITFSQTLEGRSWFGKIQMLYKYYYPLNDIDHITVNSSVVPVTHMCVGRPEYFQMVHVLHLAVIEHVLYLRHLRV